MNIRIIGTACILALGLSSAAQAASNGVPAPNLAPNSAQDNIGHVLCTAAINSDGTIAGGLMVRPAPRTAKVGTGTYQVSFAGACGDIRAIKGWMRMVQPDTLATGSVGARYCTTADRAGDVSGVFVDCKDGTGAAADTSFMIQVSR